LYLFAPDVFSGLAGAIHSISVIALRSSEAFADAELRAEFAGSVALRATHIRARPACREDVLRGT